MPHTPEGAACLQAATAALRMGDMGGVSVDVGGALAMAQAGGVSGLVAGPLIAACAEGLLIGLGDRRGETENER